MININVAVLTVVGPLFPAGQLDLHVAVLRLRVKATNNGQARNSCLILIAVMGEGGFRRIRGTKHGANFAADNPAVQPLHLPSTPHSRRFEYPWPSCLTVLSI